MDTNRLLILVLACTTVQAARVVDGSLDVSNYALPALDCRHPKMIRNGLLSGLCNSTKPSQEGTEVATLILQYSSKHIVDAVRCERVISRMTLICGAFSHTKLVSPMDILEPIPFKQEDCYSTIMHRMYTKEDGNTLPIDVDRFYDYKFVEHGKLILSHDNVACSGSTVYVNGEEHSGLVTLVTARVSFTSVKLELDIGQAQDLDNNQELPSSCARDKYCMAGTAAYFIKHPDSACALYQVRTIPMREVQLNTATGIKKAMVSHEHKLLFVLGGQESAPVGCSPLFSVLSTIYKDIKLVTEAEATVSIASMAAALTASEVDLNLEFRVVDEYLSYSFEKLMKEKLTRVGSQLCTMNRHSLAHSELSPFHPDALLRVRGEIVQELTCTRVQVNARIGDKRSEDCLADSLPVWLQNEPVFLQAETHLIIESAELSQVPCKSLFVLVFRASDDTLLLANPSVEVVNLRLTHLEDDYLHLLDDSDIIHETFASDMLYTTAEVDAFNQLLHFSRTKSRVLDALVAQYCSGEDCGSYKPSVGTSSFNLEGLKDQLSPWHWLGDIRDELTEVGSYCSILVLLYIALTILVRCYHFVRLSCKRVPVRQAARYSFLIDHALRDALVEESMTRPETPPSRSLRRPRRAVLNPEVVQEDGYMEMEGMPLHRPAGPTPLSTASCTAMVPSSGSTSSRHMNRPQQV